MLVYADDLNIISTAEDIEEAMASLKKEFEMKDLRPTSIWAYSSNTSLEECLCTGLQRGYLKFNMGKYHPLRTPNMVQPWKWIRTHLDSRVMMRKYWNLKFPT